MVHSRLSNSICRSQLATWEMDWKSMSWASSCVTDSESGNVSYTVRAEGGEADPSSCDSIWMFLPLWKPGKIPRRSPGGMLVAAAHSPARVDHDGLLLTRHLQTGQSFALSLDARSSFSCSASCIQFLGLPEQSTTNWVLKQLRCILSRFWKLEAWNQVVHRTGLFWCSEAETVVCLSWGQLEVLGVPWTHRCITQISAVTFFPPHLYGSPYIDGGLPWWSSG